MVRVDFTSKPKPKQQLVVELVPQTSWYSNVRSMVPKSQWDIIREKAYEAAGYECEICGGMGPQWPVECHEIWEYNDKKHTQTLVGFIALCPSCHQVKHMGLARIRGKHKEAEAHLAKVNGWSARQVTKHVTKAFKQHARRSHFPWEVNIDYLEQYEGG